LSIISGAPLPWQGLKIARHLPPVCPQKLPDLSPHGSENMSRGRHKHLSRLLPYLRTESEDCLYLNLYVPHEGEFEIAICDSVRGVMPMKAIFALSYIVFIRRYIVIH